MSRSDRLIALAGHLRAVDSATVEVLADRFDVHRRTVIPRHRDAAWPRNTHRNRERAWGRRSSAEGSRHAFGSHDAGRSRLACGSQVSWQWRAHPLPWSRSTRSALDKILRKPSGATCVLRRIMKRVVGRPLCHRASSGYVGCPTRRTLDGYRASAGP